MNTTSTSAMIYDLEYFPTHKKIFRKKYLPLDGREYHILTYDKNMICFDDTETSKYRSVVFSENRLVCFSPPKSIPYDVFIQKYPESTEDESKYTIISNQIHVTETIEGTMINLFYDPSHSTWEIATKNAIGGRYWYFRNNYYTVNSFQPTFRDMFMDAIQEEHFTSLNDTKLVQNLPKDCCYSFVLQHPQNHLVLDIQYPRIYLVAVYQLKSEIPESFPMVLSEPPRNAPYSATFLPISTIMHHTHIQELCANHIIHVPFSIPRAYNYTGSKYKIDFCELFKHMMGITFVHSQTGDRMKLENYRYLYKKDLRGNHPNLQYQYLCLVRIGKVDEFIQHFPAYKSVFDTFRKHLKHMIDTIHQIYYLYYIKKLREIEYSKRIMYFVKRIHYDVFINSLKGKSKTFVQDSSTYSESERRNMKGTQRTIITKQVVHNWLFANFEPNAILFHLNFMEDVGVFAGEQSSKAFDTMLTNSAMRT